MCDQKLLAIKMRDKAGLYYILPGGGQKPGEPLSETVRRECLEEIGVEVRVEELLYVREYIGKNHTFSDRHAKFHQVESVFRCSLADPHAVCAGIESDLHQIGVSWLSIPALDQIRFYPERVKAFFTEGRFGHSPLYLGDCN